MSTVEVKTAVILAGGAGLRLRPLTNGMPKAMVSVAGKPLLHWILEWLKQNGVSNFVLGVAHEKEKLMTYFDNGKDLGISIKYSVHTVEGGTAEGFRLAIERHVTDEMFLAMNGDELVDINVREFALYHERNGGIATLAVAPLRSPYGVVQLEGSDVIGFQEKPILNSHHVSVGTYMFSRQILNYLPRKGDIERTVFPNLCALRQMKAYLHSGFWATVNTVKDLEEVETRLKGRKD